MEKATQKTKVLAVDDNEDALFALEKILNYNGFAVETANCGQAALDALYKSTADVVLLDVMMPGMDGYEVTKTIKNDEHLKYTPVILLTAKDNLEDVTKGLNEGADDYIKKPFKQEELIARLNAVLRTKRLYEELKKSDEDNKMLRKVAIERSSFSNLIGKSSRMQAVFELIERVKDTSASVLITGESGTGKELVARAIHYNSPRKNKPFVVQNCSAFNENLLESELFGHVKGSFSGAMHDKPGLFKVADGGSFFLDELGEMSPSLQAKLLRVLQDGTFTPVGATSEEKVDVRIIAATHRDLKQMISAGKFREDLYYRLNVVTLALPPLRDRKEDIPLLISHYLETLAKKNKTSLKNISEEAYKRLIEYNWPGNVRQLANEIEKLIILSGKLENISSEILSPEILGELKEQPKGKALEGKLKEAVDQLERDMIVAALERTDWNKSEAARELGISRSNLIAKIQSYGLDE